jgi:hypothetical protein
VTGAQIDASYLYEEARYGIYQHGPSAIVFAGPKRAGHKGVRSFRLDLIAGWPVPFDEIRIGTRPIGPLPIETGGESRIVFRDGRTYGVIIPLVLRPAADPSPVRLRVANGHLMISLFNYDGPECDFTREELTGWRNGFVIVLSTEQQWSSFEEFCLRAVLLRVDDTMREDRIRQVRCETPDGIMAAEYDPGREMFLSRTWNGAAETIDHLMIEAGKARLPLLDPLTIYGSEAGPR